MRQCRGPGNHNVYPATEALRALSLKLVQIYHLSFVILSFAVLEIVIALLRILHKLGKLEADMQHAILGIQVGEPLLKAVVL